MEPNTESVNDKDRVKVGLDDRRAALLTTLEIVKAKRHFFVLTLVLTVVGTILGHFLKVPSFQTHAALYVQNLDQPSASDLLLKQSSFHLSQPDRMESYINHLKSDSFYLRIAERIKFHDEFENLVLEVPDEKSKLGFKYWKTELFGGDDGKASYHNKLLTPIESMVGFLKSVVTYHPDFNTQFIQIHTRTLDARTSQLLANLIAEEFVEITNTHSLIELKQIEDFVKTKIEETEARVKDLDKSLIEFKQRHNIVSADASTRTLADRLSRLEQQQEAAELQTQENKKLIDFYEKGRQAAISTIISNGSKINGFGGDETEELLQNKLDQLRKQKSAFIAQGYPPESFQIKNIDTEIDQITLRFKDVLAAAAGASVELDPTQTREKIRKLEQDNDVLKTKMATLRRARADLQHEVDLMPRLQQEYLKIQNSFKLEIDSLAHLQRKEKELEIQRISHKKEVRVDQLAPFPKPTPRGNLILKLLFSSLAALFLGVLIILGLEALDPTVKRRQDLYDCGVEFFGEVPFMTDKLDNASRRNMDFGSPSDLVCYNKPDSIESMAFKYMRARLESMRYKTRRDSQVIAISSALHNEGKSYVSANLAISLSQLKRRTILIDADLRRPSQVSYFGLSGQHGLVDLLNLNKPLGEVLIREVYPNLDVLPTGFCGSDSTEIISSQKFRVLIEFLRNEYEYVVVDTPPTFAVVDPAVIASYADIPILVSCFRETRKADLHEAYNDLLQVSFKKVYGIINKAIVSNARIHYYGYPLSKDAASNAPVANLGKVDEDTEAFKNQLTQKSS